MENKIVLDYELIEKLAKSMGYLVDFIYGQLEMIFRFIEQNRFQRAKIEYDYMVAVLENEKAQL